MQIPSVQPAFLPSSLDQLILVAFLSLHVDTQRLRSSSEQPAAWGVGAAGMEQALPGKDRCKSSGFHMKRSCLE